MMTEENQRIAIADFVAEATGKPWKSEHLGGGTYWNTNFPDYLNDLNAIHEAENHYLVMPYSRGDESYAVQLFSVLSREDGEPFELQIPRDLFDAAVLLNAPAKFRAEALLRVIGKWVDG